MKNLSIDDDRFREDFEALGRIGREGEGVNRPAFSEAHLEARAWFHRRAKDVGLQVRTDGAGNHFARLNCGPEGAQTLLVGSHLDSVVHGGRYDGALGVLAALEALRCVKEKGIRLPYHLEAVDFTDEEGNYIGLMGSSAAVGKLTREELFNPRGGREGLVEGMQRAGLTNEGVLAAKLDPGRYIGYLELHIEQGPRLEKAGVQIGVVSAITGIGSYQVSFLGRADHAGTTPMEDRIDAGLAAAEFSTMAHETVIEEFPGCVTNIGWMKFQPGAYNIVPERADVALEYRSANEADFDRLEKELLKLAEVTASRMGCELTLKAVGKHEPVQMATGVRVLAVQVCRGLGYSMMEMVSGAGHDAQMVAEICPAGMIFIPSVGGASHSAREFSRWEDCVRGANVVLNTAVQWGQSSAPEAD